MRNGKWKVFVRNDSVASIHVLFLRNQTRGHRPRNLISTVQLEFQGGRQSEIREQRVGLFHKSGANKMTGGRAEGFPQSSSVVLENK